eukprot:g4320.t1
MSSSNPYEGKYEDYDEEKEDMGYEGKSSLSSYRNPFQLPPDEEVFSVPRKNQKKLKVWEKKTSASRTGSIKPIRKTFSRLEKEALDGPKGKSSKHSGRSGRNGVGVAQAASAALKGSEWRTKTEKDNMADFIAKKREMFLVQMSLDTKKQEIRKLEEKAQNKETALKNSELMLEEDAMRFDTFLKDNDAKAHEAIKRAEAETKLKQDRVAEIKKLNQSIATIKSDTSKLQEQLEDCLKYKHFLDSLTPPEWFSARKQEKQERMRKRMVDAREEKIKEWETAKQNVIAQHEAKVEARRRELELQGRGTKEINIKRPALPPKPTFTDKEEDYESDSDEPMYFHEPAQLLDIFTALEESNLFLIQNSQETEQALDELRHNFRETELKMEKDTAALEKNIEHLKLQIKLEEKKATALQNRAQASSGEDAQQALLKVLNEKVTEVYRKCDFDAESKPSTITMLTHLEAKLEKLLQQIENMPDEYVHVAEKKKEMERREKVRAERIQLQQEVYQRKLEKSMQRSMQAPKKRHGRPIMFRVRPNRVNKKKVTTTKIDEKKDMDEHFFQ